MTRFWTATAVTLAVLFFGQPSVAESRIALVIGNGGYGTIGALRNPPFDARLMSGTLRQLGFDVIERIDADQKTMKRGIRAFGKKLETAGKDAVGLFYYAGHGIQVGGVNYMIPVNVNIEDESDVDIEAVSADAVLGEMAFAGNRLNIVVMDACRNNPFKRGFRSVSRGLARMDATKGTLIAYATSPGDVAADGDGLNSPYTEALSKAMLTPGLTVERMFKVVRNQVVAATESKQVPWEASSLTGADFYFKGGTPSVSSTARSGDEKGRETAFWESIKDSDRPSEFEAFINAFPDSPFSALARVRVQALKKPQPAPESRQSPPTAGPETVEQETLFWESIKDSSDPGDFKAYIDEYPDGKFVRLAENRLARVRNPEVAALRPAARPARPKEKIALPALPINANLVSVDVAAFSPRRLKELTNRGYLDDMRERYQTLSTDDLKKLLMVRLREAAVFNPNASDRLILRMEMIEVTDTSSRSDPAWYHWESTYRYTLSTADGHVVLNRDMTSTAQDRTFGGRTRFFEIARKSWEANIDSFVALLRKELPAKWRDILAQQERGTTPRP